MKRLEIPIGSVFGEGTVTGYASVSCGGKQSHINRTVCVLSCSCGNAYKAKPRDLVIGRIKTCGCVNPMTSHRKKGSPEYYVWAQMKQRCYNPKSNVFHNYGGRGIKVCDEWVSDFMAFYNHIGPRPSSLHSIDRIDVNGNYEPGNVRWALSDVQDSNKRNTRKVTIGGVTICARKFAKKLGVNPSSVYRRLNKNQSPEEIANAFS